MKMESDHESDGMETLTEYKRDGEKTVNDTGMELKNRTDIETVHENEIEYRQERMELKQVDGGDGIKKLERDNSVNNDNKSEIIESEEDNNVPHTEEKGTRQDIITDTVISKYTTYMLHTKK